MPFQFLSIADLECFPFYFRLVFFCVFFFKSVTETTSFLLSVHVNCFNWSKLFRDFMKYFRWNKWLPVMARFEDDINKPLKIVINHFTCARGQTSQSLLYFVALSVNYRSSSCVTDFVWIKRELSISESNVWYFHHLTLPKTVINI